MEATRNAKDQTFTEQQDESALRDWLRWIIADYRVLVSGGVILIVCLMAIAAPLLTGEDPQRIGAHEPFLAPGTGGILGTDEFGRDMLARIIYGSRLTLLVSLASVGMALVIGTAMGMAAAFYGNPADMILMRLTDAVLSFPPILLAIFVVTFWGASITNVILVIGLLYAPRFARIAYGSTLSVREFDFIEASRAIGARPVRIMLLGILPNIVAPLLVQISLLMGTAILLESTLSFLGLGPPEMVSWGRSIQQSSRFLGTHAWGVVWPAIAISVTVLAFNILGDALRDRLDPRLR